MGTAVLFPQDCLRPRSRHKHQTSGMIYPPECAPRSKRYPTAPVQRQEAGLLPLPGHGSSPMNIPRRGSDTNHFKSRKGVEQRDSNPPPKVVSDIPVYKILQRPKQGDAAVKLLAQFVMLDEVKTRTVMMVAENASTEGPRNDGLDRADKPNKHEFGSLDNASDGSKIKSRGSDSKVVKVCNEGGSVCQPKDVSKSVNGVHTSIAEGYKLPNIKMGVLKPKNVTTEKVHSAPDDSTRPPPPSKPFMTKAAGKVNDVSCKAVIVQRSGEHDSVLPKGLTRLRRTSTEPQITTHILDQYRSKMMHISFNNSKTESHAHSRGFSNSASLSCQERWAGPAYTSSPSPSSLPLPKLCLPHTRFSSLEIPPLVKQYSTSVYMQPFLGSSAPSENRGAWDVACAESLRKMLNLDPC